MLGNTVWILRKDDLSFADGHAGFTRIYCNGVAGSHPAENKPPLAYDYMLEW